MAGTLVLKRVDPNPGGRTVRRQYVFVASGNYTAGNAVGVAGETLNFNIGGSGGIVCTNPKGKPREDIGGTFAVDDFTIARVPAGYSAILEANAVNPGFNNVVLRFFTTAAAELTGAPTAYPAGLLGQDVVIEHVSDKKNG